MIEIILDASQIECFEACPRKWFYDYQQNLTVKQPNAALSTGSFYHECLKFYYTMGQPLANAIIPTLRYANSIAISDKWPSVGPLRDFHVTRLRDYIYYNLSEDEQSEIVAVEKGFSRLLYEDEDVRYILEGMIDLVHRRSNTRLTVTDHKTQSRKYEKYPFCHQAMNYLSFTKADTFEYNYIGLQETPNKDTFRREIYRAAPGVLLQWEQDVFHTFNEVARCIINNDFMGDKYIEENFPRRRVACQTKFGVCQFHKICEVPNNSKFIPAIIAGAYTQKEPWKAWS